LTSIPMGLRIYVDSVTGNDSTGLVSRQDKPFLTISAALASATSGYLLMLSPGTFTEDVEINVPDGVSINGAGIDVTVINSAQDSDGLARVILSPGTGSNFSN